MKTKEEILAYSIGCNAENLKDELADNIIKIALSAMESYAAEVTALKDETITGLSKLNETGIQMQATLQGEMDKLFERNKELEAVLEEIRRCTNITTALYLAKIALAGKD